MSTPVGMGYGRPWIDQWCPGFWQWTDPEEAHMIQQQLVQLAVAQLVGVSNCGGHHCLGGLAEAGSADCLELGLFGHAVEDVHLHLGRYQVSCTPCGKVEST